MTWSLRVLCLAAAGSAAWAQLATEPVHWAVDVTGAARLQRKGWTSATPLRFGMRLAAGDVLWLEPGSRVKIACADLSVKEVAERVAEVPCGTARAVLRIGPAHINATRSVEPQYPSVISPRYTKILSVRPVLRWSSVEGAGAYKVEVWSGSKAVWSGTATATELTYPSRAAKLQPGVAYHLVVQAGTTLSSTENAVPGAGFVIMLPDEARTAREEAARVRAAGLGAAASAFLVAAAYASRGLYAEAIDLLGAAPELDAEAGPLRLRGDLYLRVRLIRHAEAAYVSALQRSLATGDVWGQAMSRSTLARIYWEGFRNRSEAAAHIREAAKLAGILGDAEIRHESARLLEEIER